jgi:hypothetical protein
MRRRLAACLGIAAAFWLGLAQPAGAVSMFQCSAELNGQPAWKFDSPSNALRVAADDRISVSARITEWSADPVTGAGQSNPAPQNLVYRVKLEIAGVRWTVADGIASGASWSDSVSVKQYATHGAGIYKILAVSIDGAGNQCFGRAYVRVGDEGPVGTTAGLAGAGAATLGVAGAAAAGLRKPRGLNELMEEGENLVEESRQEPAAVEGEREITELKTEQKDVLTIFEFCGTTVIAAVGATAWAMASEHAARVVAAIGRLWR